MVGCADVDGCWAEPSVDVDGCGDVNDCVGIGLCECIERTGAIMGECLVERIRTSRVFLHFNTTISS